MDKRKQNEIPYFNEINDFLEAAQVKNRTDNPMFYCMRLQEHKDRIYMIPFKRGFYFVGLFFKPDFKNEFPFFNVLNTTLFQIDKELGKQWGPISLHQDQKMLNRNVRHS